MRFLFLIAALFAGQAFAETPTTKAEFDAAHCDYFNPEIVGSLGNNLYEAQSNITLVIDQKTANYLQRHTPFLIKTKTKSFQATGNAGFLILHRKGQQEISLKNGFKTKVWVYEESAKCQKMWDSMQKDKK